MELTDQTIRQALSFYGIRETVLRRETLVDIDRQYEKTRAVKLYTRLTLPSGRVVLKLLHLPMCSDDALERQSSLAESFRAFGLPTPECFSLSAGASDRSFVASIEADGLDCRVKLEADAGTAVAAPDESLAPVLGRLLGRMHHIAEAERLSVGPGAFYTEFFRGNTGYDLLWKRCGTEFLPEDRLDRIRGLYDRRMAALREGVFSLPRFAVQGDLYYMNLTKNGTQYQVIDYDRMGDELLLTDMIITWHRFWFDPQVFGLKHGDASHRAQREQMLWEQFFLAYCDERRLTDKEYGLLPCAYQLFGAVYGTRMLAAAASAGQKKLAASLLPDVEDILVRPRSFAR